MEIIKKIQNTDPLAIAEEVTGKSYKNDEETSMLGLAMHLEKCKIMNNLMDSTNDTKFSETEENYLKKVTEFGFESVLVEPFLNEDGIEERLHILWHKEYSILLVFDTYTWGDDGSWAKAGKEVPKPFRNGGHFYYNWSPNSDTDFSYVSSGGCVGIYFKEDFSSELTNPEKEPVWGNISYKQYRTLYDGWSLKNNQWIRDNNLKTVWSGYHDCREALKNNINGLAKTGVFLKKWKKSPFIWLLHYMDTKQEGYDYEAINQKRIALLPDYVKECILT